MKAVIFDIDNTLYDVDQYAISAFHMISDHVSKKFNLAKKELYIFLYDLWKEKTSMYPYLFDDFCTQFQLKNELYTLITLFNNHKVELKPYEDVVPTLKELQALNYMLGVITDGIVEKQKRKIHSLELEEYFNEIIYTKELQSPKPSLLPFQKILERFDLSPKQSYYVGDNPFLDFEGPKQLGITTLRIMKGEFKNYPNQIDIDYEIKNIKDIITIVDKD